MIRPPAWSGIFFSAILVTRYNPFRFVSKMSYHFPSSASVIMLKPEMPALFTRTFTGPHVDPIISKPRSTSALLRTSIGSGRTGSESFFNSSAARSTLAALREAMATFAPFWANFSAIALPIPVPPPVISAILALNIYPLLLRIDCLTIGFYRGNQGKIDTKAVPIPCPNFVCLSWSRNCWAKIPKIQ